MTLTNVYCNCDKLLDQSLRIFHNQWQIKSLIHEAHVTLSSSSPQWLMRTCVIELYYSLFSKNEALDFKSDKHLGCKLFLKNQWTSALRASVHYFSRMACCSLVFTYYITSLILLISTNYPLVLMLIESCIFDVSKGSCGIIDTTLFPQNDINKYVL